MLTSTGAASLTVAKAASVVNVKAQMLEAKKRAEVAVGVVTPGQLGTTVQIELRKEGKEVKVVMVELSASGTATWTTPRLTGPGGYKVRVTYTGSATSDAATTEIELKIKEK